ncbi:hypothetical protein [Patulibacter americanus]|uniref:hypothetical protein n=1 Tax=Patulibacter americanus TaxID=588672 RepID=UPI0003B4BC6E|nr:hypothetical protein [Patulibacter americanus]
MFTPVKIVRFWLPFLIFVVGAAMLLISPDIVGVEGFALMLGGGLGVVVSNRIHRMGLQGEKDRDDEMDARAFLDKYGVWPDEASDEILDRAERAGDIAPRPAGPAEDVPADPAPGAGTTGTGAGTTGSGDAHERHPHADARRTGRRSGSSRPPRR